MRASRPLSMPRPRAAMMASLVLALTLGAAGTGAAADDAQDPAFDANLDPFEGADPFANSTEADSFQEAADAAAAAGTANSPEMDSQSPAIPAGSGNDAPSSPPPAAGSPGKNTPGPEVAAVVASVLALALMTRRRRA